MPVGVVATIVRGRVQAMSAAHRSVPMVLVVDDEENISYLVASALKLEGHEVLTAATGGEAVETVAHHAPDLVVLDVMLPDIDGYEVLRRIRNGGFAGPVLFLTARDTTEDRVRGLTAGGDDYIVKPFALAELVARVQVALRRRGGPITTRLQVGDLTIDDDAHRVWRGEDEKFLSATEYKLLWCLAANAGRVVTRTQILDHVWQYDFDGESSIIESFMSNLRKKVDTSEPKLIHTVRGVGYSMREPK
jgi:two-component system, OmpR family, response regulator